MVEEIRALEQRREAAKRGVLSDYVDGLIDCHMADEVTRRIDILYNNKVADVLLREIFKKEETI